MNNFIFIGNELYIPPSGTEVDFIFTQGPQLYDETGLPVLVLATVSGRDTIQQAESVSQVTAAALIFGLDQRANIESAGLITSSAITSDLDQFIHVESASQVTAAALIFGLDYQLSLEHATIMAMAIITGIFSLPAQPTVPATANMPRSGGDGVCLVVGVCSLGEPGRAYLLGKSSDISAQLGVGPLVDRLRDIMATGGQNPTVIAVPVQGSGGGYISPITHVGTGPDITVGGTVKADADIRLLIMSTGGRNVGAYQLSIDGAHTWGEVQIIPVNGRITVGTTGISIIVPDIDPMIIGDTYSFKLLAPVPSISSVLEAIEQPLRWCNVEFCYIAGPSDSVDWAALAAKSDELWTRHIPVFFIVETRLPGENESLSEWASAMIADRQGFSSRFISVCAAFGEVSDSTGTRFVRSFGGLLTGRILSIPVMRAIGRVRDAGISPGLLPRDFTEPMQKSLEANGYITAKRYAGLNAAYWGDAKTMADPTSDYQHLEVVRTVFKAIRKARVAALDNMYDESGDSVSDSGVSGLKSLRANLEKSLNTMVAAVPSELAGYVVTIPPGQDIVNNGVAVEMALIGIPIIRQIKLFSRYVYAGSGFDSRLEG